MSCLVQGNVSGVMDFQEVWNEKECIEERRAPKGIEGRKMAQGSQQGQPMLNDVEFLSEGSRPLEERSVKASGTASTEWGGQQASEQNLGVVQNLNMQEFLLI